MWGGFGDGDGFFMVYVVAGRGLFGYEAEDEECRAGQSQKDECSVIDFHIGWIKKNTRINNES